MYTIQTKQGNEWKTADRFPYLIQDRQTARAFAERLAKETGAAVRVVDHKDQIIFKSSHADAYRSALIQAKFRSMGALA